jgi:hypothetical protein
MRDASLTLGMAMVLGSLSLGCSSDPPLDCAWLASDNCWKMTASSAASCLPASTTSGTFSADKKTCTYTGGAVVSFATALTLPLPDSPTWDFTLSNGGQPCLRYTETAGGSVTLTVSGKTFSEAPMGSMGLAVTCPDGKRYSTDNAFNLLACGGNFLSGLPGSSTFDTSTSVSFGLIGTSASSDQSLSVFDCRTP